MFVIEVTPIKRGLGKESLSYFSASKIDLGSLVKILVQSREVWGVVSLVEPVSTQKTELKKSSFVLKKILPSKKNQKIFFDDWWLKAVGKIAEYFASTSGSIMAAFTPVAQLKNIQKFWRPVIHQTKIQKKKEAINIIKSEILCTQTDDTERWGYYKSAIREEFAKKHSVFLILPTLEDIKAAKTYFEKGIEQYTYVFNSEVKELELLNRWNDCLSEEHPVLVIATASWLHLPRSDFGTIILDKENSGNWKTLSRPYIDMRKVVEIFAKERETRLILGDSVLQIETLWRYKNDEIFSFKPVKFRITSNTETQLAVIKGPKIISPKLIDLIERTTKENKNLFIYTTRKGLAAITVCNDCGAEVLCHNCSSPMVLYKSSKENIFRCHQCNSIRSANEVCKKCGSWRLLPLGVGVEKVAEEINKILKNADIFQISGNSTTKKRAIQIADKFYKTAGSILVGTEMALHYLKSPVDFTAVASIESLFSVPDYKIREKIFHLILSMKLLAREKCLVQIRNAEKTTLELALAGNILDFYKREIEERELLQYPPFSVFIKITIRGGRTSTEKESKFLEQFLKEWNPIIFESSAERHKSPAAYNCVIKIPRDEWFDKLTINGHKQELFQKLLSLPPNFEIKVNPDNLL